MLNFVDKVAVEIMIHLTQGKQFQGEITSRQLRDKNDVSKMITNDQILASSKEIRGTPQFW